MFFVVHNFFEDLPHFHPKEITITGKLMSVDVRNSDNIQLEISPWINQDEWSKFENKQMKLSTIEEVPLKFNCSQGCRNCELSSDEILTCKQCMEGFLIQNGGKSCVKVA